MNDEGSVHMYSAKAIANYFLDKADEDSISLSPMKIIKIVYIAHGWYLALTDEPLIEDYVEAWTYGPVIPELYHEFKQFGSNPIPVRAIETTVPSIYIGGSSRDLPFSTDQFLDRIWDIYKGFTALQLSSATHQPDTPWHITMQNGSGKKNPVIEDELIRKYYVDMIDENGKTSQS